MNSTSSTYGIYLMAKEHWPKYYSIP